MKNQWVTTAMAIALSASFGAGCTDERGGGLGAPDTPTSATGTSSTLSRPSAAIIGKDVVDMKGDRVGEVSAVTEDRVIVETGGFLGLGARRVAFDTNQLTTVGSGSDLKLQTSMTREQIRDLPEVRDEGRSRGILGR